MHMPIKVFAANQPEKSQTKGKTMTPRVIASMLTASAAVLPAASLPTAPLAAQSVMEPSQTIVVSVGRGQLVSIPGTMSDIFIANDGVADVQIKSTRQLYIYGKRGGQTTIYASNSSGAIIWAANVRVGNNIDSVDQMLSLAMPNADISVATMGSNMVLLTGTVAAPEDAREAQSLVSAFLGDGANVVSRLKTATPLQVNLRVRFAEVSRSLVRSMGASLTTVDNTGGFLFGLNSGRGDGAVSINTETGNVTFNGLSSATTIGGFGSLLGLDIGGALDLAERNGLATTLSEPNLTAISGETASFHAGGEFPIPISTGLGATSIQYKNYGVLLTYTPTVMANGRIQLKVKPEVSELSTQGSVTLNGFQVPGTTIRRAETTVELGSGQSFMIAGLMSNNAQSTIDKTPGAGDVPILGNLFKSREFRKGQTELVIVVTPYLVKPVNDREIALPTDGFHAANEFQQLVGLENDGVDGERRPMPRAGDTTSNAQLGDASDEAPAQAGNSSDDRNRERATSAAPGFSLK